MEIVVNNEGVDRLARYENQSGSGQPEEHQHEEHPLFVMVDSRNSLKEVWINRKAWYDNNAALTGRVGEDVTKLNDQPLLKRLEETTLFRRSRYHILV